MKTFRVVVDVLSRQGKENVAVSLVTESDQSLPEWEAGAHITM